MRLWPQEHVYNDGSRNSDHNPVPRPLRFLLSDGFRHWHSPLRFLLRPFCNHYARRWGDYTKNWRGQWGQRCIDCGHVLGFALPRKRKAAAPGEPR